MGIVIFLSFFFEREREREKEMRNIAYSYWCLFAVVGTSTEW